jgi:SnoaL-like polyketide cyclase
MEDFMSYKHLPGLFEKALNEKRIELFDEFIHPEYKNHNPQVQPGPAGVKAFFEHYLNAFPDTQVVMEDVIEEGDRVSARLTYKGTFTNPFMGYRPNRAPDPDAEHRYLARQGREACRTLGRTQPAGSVSADWGGDC